MAGAKSSKNNPQARDSKEATQKLKLSMEATVKLASDKGFGIQKIRRFFWVYSLSNPTVGKLFAQHCVSPTQYVTDYLSKQGV